MSEVKFLLRKLWIHFGLLAERVAGKFARTMFKLLLMSRSRQQSWHNGIGVYVENYITGGLERFLIDFLSRSNHPSFVACNAQNVRIPAIAAVNSIPYVHLPIIAPTAVQGKLAKAVTLFSRRFIFLVNYWRVHRFLVSAHISQLLVVNGGYPGADSCRAAVIAAAQLGIQPILSVLSDPTPYFVSGSTSIAGVLQRIMHTLDWVIDDAVMNSAQVVHVNCTQSKADLESLMQFPKELIHVIPTGVNMHGWFNSRSSSQSDVCIGMVGRLEPLKGQENLIKAIQLTKNKRIRGLIVGNGPDLEKLRQIALECGNQTTVVGYVSSIKDVYKSIDIFAFTSLHEGLPYVIEEAMSYGVPVVSFDVGGVSDLIHDGETGFLVPLGDVDALARKLNWLCDRSEIRKSVGDRGRELVREKFSIDSMVQQLKALMPGW